MCIVIMLIMLVKFQINLQSLKWSSRRDMYSMVGVKESQTLLLLTSIVQIQKLTSAAIRTGKRVQRGALLHGKQVYIRTHIFSIYVRTYIYQTCLLLVLDLKVPIKEKARVKILNGWFCRCDRIIWFGKALKQNLYGRCELRLSDHRPVYSIFTYTEQNI